MPYHMQGRHVTKRDICYEDLCCCNREELQSYKDARLVYQGGDGMSAVLSAGCIAHLEAELRNAEVELSLKHCRLFETFYQLAERRCCVL